MWLTRTSKRSATTKRSARRKASVALNVADALAENDGERQKAGGLSLAFASFAIGVACRAGRTFVRQRLTGRCERQIAAPAPPPIFAPARNVGASRRRPRITFGQGHPVERCKHDAHTSIHAAHRRSTGRVGAGLTSVFPGSLVADHGRLTQGASRNGPPGLIPLFTSAGQSDTARMRRSAGLLRTDASEQKTNGKS